MSNITITNDVEIIQRPRCEVQRFKPTGKYYDTLWFGADVRLTCLEMFESIKTHHDDKGTNPSRFVYIVTGNGSGVENLHPRMFGEETK